MGIGFGAFASPVYSVTNTGGNKKLPVLSSLHSPDLYQQVGELSLYNRDSQKRQNH